METGDDYFPDPDPDPMVPAGLRNKVYLSRGDRWRAVCRIPRDVS